LETNHDGSISLNKFISSTGVCSRREADTWIVAGRVTINHLPVQLGNRVFPGDQVHIDGKPLQENPPLLYIAYHKPVGIVCTTDLKEPKNIIHQIRHPQRLFPIGRLDKASHGLIFLTNDGDMVNKLLRAGNNHEKEYIVSVNKPITQAFLMKMRMGVPILGTITKPCKVFQIDRFSFNIILTQGLNRQIRRMCAYLNYEVYSLQRVRIMDISIAGIDANQWRYFTPLEMKKVAEKLRFSVKTEEASLPKRRSPNA
jgi:23S rRNA pseudouridine2604 synthase